MSNIQIIGARCMLELSNFSPVAHPWDSGRIGRWKREQGKGFTYETFVQFDISKINDPIKSVQLEMRCNRASSNIGTVPVHLFEQNATDRSKWDGSGRPPVFVDFPPSSWEVHTPPLDSISVTNKGTYTFSDGHGLLKGLVEAWIKGSRNWRNGIIISAGFKDRKSWLSVNRVMLSVKTVESPFRGRGRYSVSGQVRRTDGTAVSRAVVKAYDKGVGTENLLGEFTLPARSTDGAYSIEYKPDDFTDPNKECADLFLRVMDANGNVIATSRLIVSAPRNARVVLYQPVDGPLARETEYSIISALLGPHLDQNRGNLQSLTDNDSDVLAGRLTLEPAIVKAYVRASQVSDASDADKEFLYGLFRYGLQADTRQLVSENEDSLHTAIRTGARAFIISDSYNNDAAFRVQLSRLRAKAVSGIIGADSKDTGLLRALMTHAGFTKPDAHKELLTVYTRREYKDVDGFWQLVAKGRHFNPRGVDQLKKIFEISDITTHHIDLTGELYNHAKVTKGGTSPGSRTRFSMI